MNTRQLDLVVIGAGPAGLMAAIAAARTGATVCVLERMTKVGLKLLATGGGRCNVCNTHSPEQFMDAFGRQGRFMQPALHAFGSAELRAFLSSFGIQTEEEGSKVFPRSSGAKGVLDALLRECKRLRVMIRPNAEVIALLPEGGVKTAKQTIPAKAVLLASGGKGYAALGGSASGYGLAHRAGHTVVDPLPSNVPLQIKERGPKNCSGISLSDVHVRVCAKGFSKAGAYGDLLFTHQGLSGPVILDVSGGISVALKKQETVSLVLNMAPNLGDWKVQGGNKSVVNALRPWLPAALTKIICDECEIDPEMKVSLLGKSQKTVLTERITQYSLTVIGTEGFGKAMVTRGGIRLKEVDPNTLESKLLPRLYFAGEMLDLDGPCGGFNLQWAFSSGHLAGRSAVQMK